MLSHRVIWHGRRRLPRAQAGVRRLPDRPAVPVLRRGPDRPGRGREAGQAAAPSWPSHWLRCRAEPAAAPPGCGRSPWRQATRARQELSRFLPPEDGSGRAVGGADRVRRLATDGAGRRRAADRAGRDVRTHAGQVAFPGGAVDVDRRRRRSPPRCARLRRRSASSPATCDVVAELPGALPAAAGFVVTPVLGLVARSPITEAAVDAGEVARVAVVPVAELADPANRFRVVHPSGWRRARASRRRGCSSGASPRVLLDRLLELGGWALPWDDDRVPRRCPPRAGRPAAATPPERRREVRSPPVPSVHDRCVRPPRCRAPSLLARSSSSCSVAC